MQYIHVSRSNYVLPSIKISMFKGIWNIDILIILFLGTGLPSESLLFFLTTPPMLIQSTTLACMDLQQIDSIQHLPMTEDVHTFSTGTLVPFCSSLFMF